MLQIPCPARKTEKTARLDSLLFDKFVVLLLGGSVDWRRRVVHLFGEYKSIYRYCSFFDICAVSPSTQKSLSCLSLPCDTHFYLGVVLLTLAPSSSGRLLLPRVGFLYIGVLPPISRYLLTSSGCPYYLGVVYVPFRAYGHKKTAAPSGAAVSI